MSTVAEVEMAIDQLPPQDIRALQEWITNWADRAVPQKATIGLEDHF